MHFHRTEAVIDSLTIGLPPRSIPTQAVILNPASSWFPSKAMSHLLTVHWGNAELRIFSGWDPNPFLFPNRKSRSEFLEPVLCSLQKTAWVWPAVKANACSLASEGSCCWAWCSSRQDARELGQALLHPEPWYCVWSHQSHGSPLCCGSWQPMVRELLWVWTKSTQTFPVPGAHQF